MASRESTDTTSTSGKSYPAGSGASSSAATVKGVVYSKNIHASTKSKLGSSGAFNGHAVEVFADGAVWDTTSSKYLYPGVDFNPGDVQRT